MKNKIIKIKPDLSFSYSQFFIFDHEVTEPGLEWTDKHVRQGFARRPQVISIGTLLEYGVAKASLICGTFDVFSGYHRVLAIPLRIKSGAVSIAGPEESDLNRHYVVEPGNYRVTVAQSVLGDDLEKIVILLEKTKALHQTSEILVADGGLNPILPLLETAKKA